MITCTVHEPLEPPRDRHERAESLVFVRDGFTLPAMMMPPLWCLANRAWAGLFIYVLAFLAILTLPWALGLSPAYSAVGVFALNLIYGLEGQEMKRASLDRRGWRMIGSVTGRNAEDCERRFLDAWLAETAAPALRGTTSAEALAPVIAEMAPTVPEKRPGFLRRMFQRRRKRAETAPA